MHASLSDLKRLIKKEGTIEQKQTRFQVFYESGLAD